MTQSRYTAADRRRWREKPQAKKRADAWRRARNAAFPERHAHRHMIQRCTNARDPLFPLYGARGITVCAEWRGPGGFERFIAHAGRRPSTKHSIDRINNDGNYEPGNVRWATQAQQIRNSRHARMLELDGVRLCMTDWAARVGLKKDTLRQRLRDGWDLRKALTTPVAAVSRWAPRAAG